MTRITKVERQRLERQRRMWTLAQAVTGAVVAVLAVDNPTARAIAFIVATALAGWVSSIAREYSATKSENVGDDESTG